MVRFSNKLRVFNKIFVIFRENHLQICNFVIKY